MRKILQFHKMCITDIIITFKCILQLLIMFQPVGKCIIRLARHGFFSYCKMHYLYLCLTRPRDSNIILLTFLNYKSFNLRDRNTFIQCFQYSLKKLYQLKNFWNKTDLNWIELTAVSDVYFNVWWVWWMFNT